MDHRLTQAEIMDILKKEHMIDVDRKTGVLEETSFCTDWYMTREFSDSELRLLIDSLLFTKNVPYNQCKELIEKLKGLSNIYFDKKVKPICNLPDNQPRNKEVFYTIDILGEAISQNKKVSFKYNSYGTDKKLHPRREETYIINPYQMVATNGKYYLICNYDKYDKLDLMSAFVFKL